MAFKFTNELCRIERFQGVSEQYSIVDSVLVDDRTAELVIIASNCTDIFQIHKGREGEAQRVWLDSVWFGAAELCRNEVGPDGNQGRDRSRTQTLQVNEELQNWGGTHLKLSRTGKFSFTKGCLFMLINTPS